MVLEQVGTQADISAVPREELLRMLASPKTSTRQQAAEEVVRRKDPEAAALVSQLLDMDKNENLRARCAGLLATLAPAGSAALARALEADASTAVRSAAATALGRSGDVSTIEALARAAGSDPETAVRSSAVQAMVTLGGPDASKALVGTLDAGTPGWLRAIVVAGLARIGDPAGRETVLRALRDPDPTVAKAALGALQRLDPAALLAVAGELLEPATDIKVRRRVVQELAKTPGAAVGLLSRALVSDPDENIRVTAADGLAAFGDVGAKLAAVLTEVLARRPARADVGCAAVVRAVRFPADPTGAAELTEQLLQRAEKAADSYETAVLADILVANGDPDQAGAAISGYELAHRLGPEVFEQLRIEVGGQVALSPVLKMLHEDLRKNFQIPLDALRDQTTLGWLETIASARRAFLIRMIMSMMVFGIGVILLITSVVLFTVGKLTAGQAAGSGTAFAGGLIAVLLTAYSSPVKDIRQSVSDLGAANLAFIGFIHQVLQVSHTFTASYLQGTATFEQAKQASDIINAATASATAALAGTAAPARPRT